MDCPADGARGGFPYFSLLNLRDTRDARVTGLVWTILNWILFWTRIGVRASIQTIFTLSPTGSSCANRNCIVKIMWMWHNVTISYYASWTYFTHLHAGSPYRPRALCHTPRTDPESGAMDRQTTQHQRPGEDDASRHGDWFTCWLLIVIMIIMIIITTYHYIVLYRIVFIDIMMPLAVRHPNLWLVCDLVSSMKIHLYRVSTYNNWLSDAFSCHTESCPSMTFHAMHPMGIYHFLSPFTIQSS